MKYLIFASIGISLFYLLFLLVFKRDSNFKLMRIYLMGAIFLSLLIPLINLSINTGISLFGNQPEKVVINYTVSASAVMNYYTTNEPGVWENLMSKISGINSKSLIIKIYLIVCFVFAIRIVFQIIILINHYIKSDKIKHSDCVLLYNNRFNNTFSFFKWIFIQDNQETDDLNQIITHEKIHVNQFHSFDLLVMELLTAVMWFNPLIWMMKNSIQLVHEYLADEGALKSGVDPLRYRVLLLNQVAEEKLICLSSSFSSARSPGKYSLIKKRIIMMTNKKINSKTKLGLITLIPVSAFLLILTGSVNGSLSQKTKEVSSTSGATVKTEAPEKNDKSLASSSDSTKKKQTIKVVVKGNDADTIEIESHFSDPAKSMDDVKVTGYGKQKDSATVVIRQAVKSPVSLSKGDTLIVVSDESDHGKSNMIVATRKNGKPSRILYIVDDVKTTDISMFHPEDIESLTVLKEESMKTYTSENYEGVVIITTKKKK